MFEERYKDLNAQTVVLVRDARGKLVQAEVYGEQLDGTPTWVLIHIAPHAQLKSAWTE